MRKAIADQAATLPSPPILLGHSMAGSSA